MNRIQTILKGVLVLALLVFLLYEVTKWTVMRQFVPEDKALMVINKFGDQLPADKIAVPPGENRFKGVREELLGPGRYFMNPVEYDTQLVDLTQIPAGDPQQWRFTPGRKPAPQTTPPPVGAGAPQQGPPPPPRGAGVGPGVQGR